MIKLIFLFWPPFLFAQPNAQELLRRADNNQRGKTSEAEMVIRTIRPTWKREMTLKAWLKGDDLAVLQILSPIRDRGIVYLKRNKEVWNWIPALERVIKLPPSMMSQDWMGTDFTHDDLVHESSIVNEYMHSFDPDYIERPGVDAIRIQRSTGTLSQVEFAFARTGSGRSRGAWRYFGHKNGIDWQTIVGWYEHQPTVGLGWSGSMKRWSFRGELQSYLKHASEFGQFQASLESDRLLPRNNYVRVSL